LIWLVAEVHEIDGRRGWRDLKGGDVTGRLPFAKGAYSGFPLACRSFGL
jgi:hypothetical protein